MKRRIIALLLPLAMLLSLAAQAAGDSTFPRSRSYHDQFVDVEPGVWYYANVAACYEYGLFEGKSSNLFAPRDAIRVSELIAVAARLRSAASGEDIPENEEGQPWFMRYVLYLQERELLDPALTAYFTENATRAQLAGILSAALPETYFDARNSDTVKVGYESGEFITDVTAATPYHDQILWLYSQGLLDGVDKTGSFHPNDNTTRAEAAALITRMADPSLRITLGWQVSPFPSVAAKTYANLVPAPQSASTAPDPNDAAALDAVVRKMFASGSNTVKLKYDGLSNAKAQALTDQFVESVSAYIEQMYNTVFISWYGSGSATLTFGATGYSPAQLEEYREKTLARAKEVHDQLWSEKKITRNMSELDKARAYFVWLCENCDYAEGKTFSEPLSHMAYRALCEGVAVCDGYTGAYDLLLRLEGIDCHAMSNDSHIWTVATLDGKEYHIDTTWGDQITFIDMSCFAMSADQSYAKHPW